MSNAVIVTGSGTGLGLETALLLAQRGFDVYATVRNLEQVPAIKDAAAARDTSVEIVRLDLTDPASIDHAISVVVARSGGIYGLVNNGGIGLRGCVEDVSADEVRQVFEANVFGTIEVTKAVLPHLRAAGRGRIVTISSVGGRISSFGVGIYCASKFAQEGLAEALALEVAPFGVQSVIVEPGIIKTTRWDEHRGIARDARNPTSAYYHLFQASEDEADRVVERSRTRPEDVAAAVHAALTSKKPKMRYVVGRPAAAAIMLRRYLPAGLFERVYFGSLVRRIRSRALTAQ